MTLEAIDNGTRRLYRQSHLSRMVFPQELKALVDVAGGFEFVQWFFGFKRHQILERSKHPLLMVVVLRRRGRIDPSRGERRRSPRRPPTGVRRGRDGTAGGGNAGARTRRHRAR